MVAIAD